MKTKNILYLEWNSFCNEDMFQVMTEQGFHIIKIPFKREENKEKEQIYCRIREAANKAECEFLFSFNYFPTVSDCCMELHLRYVSWIYDNPYLHAYSYTVLNKCNYIFLFDYSMYLDLKQAGIPTVYYLPMAVNEKRLSGIRNTLQDRKKYTCDISFVGSLYTEPKHRLYDKFQNIPPFAKGYLDALIQAQLSVLGVNFLQEMLTPYVVEEMQKAYPTNPDSDSVLSGEAIYADYVLARQVTALERRQILEELGKMGKVDLYTHDLSLKLSGVRNHGAVDYYREMPYVFQNSKINLNITLRSIKTGIPLRAMDIMGCGGFLLTNYQEEFLEYFVPEEDFVFFEDREELKDKVKFYLEHEKERKRIAENGCRKVRKEHTLRKRMEYILGILSKEENRTD